MSGATIERAKGDEDTFGAEVADEGVEAAAGCAAAAVWCSLAAPLSTHHKA
jgi:hypothetical protein